MNLDTSFGTNGIVRTNFGASTNNSGAGAVAIQQNGKIVAAGYSNPNGKFEFALARYTTGGEKDTGFGADGKVLTPFDGDAQASALAIQPNKKIVVAGSRTTADGTNDFALARYKKRGVLDPDFGTGGKVHTDLGGDDNATAIAIQSDGMIVVAGSSNAQGSNDFVLVRYTKRGELDPTFGQGGKVFTGFDANTDDAATAVAIQPDSNIVVAGSSGAGGDPSSFQFGLVRYTPDGALDPSFGDGGMVRTDFGTPGSDQANAMTIQEDGKIVVVGLSKQIGSQDFAVARYLPSGRLDPDFSAGGTVVTDIVAANTDTATAVVIQEDGKIVAAGVTAKDGSDTGTSDFALARYTPGGVLDTDGTMVTDIGSVVTAGGPATADYALGAAIQSDGKIVVVGWTAPSSDGPFDFAVLRYLSG